MSAEPQDRDEPRRFLRRSRRWFVLVGVLLTLLLVLGALTTFRTMTEQASAQRLAAEYKPPTPPTRALSSRSTRSSTASRTPSVRSRSR